MVKVEENGDAAGGNLEPEQYRKMFIGGLTSTTTDETLKEFYSKWGTLVDCVVMRDPATKRSRGFGFVSYAKQSEVDDAMINRPHVIDGKTVDPKRAVPRDQSQRSEANISSKRLYISGVRDEHTEDMFKEHFGKYGTIVKCEIINDKNTGKPRGFAFITFDDYDAVDKCVLVKSHMINNFRCDVKKALSKEEMSKAQLHERERMDRGTRTRGPPMGRGAGYGPGGDRGGYGGGGGPPWNSGPGGYAPGGSGAWGPSGGGYGGGGAAGYGGGGPAAGRGYGGDGGWGGPPAQGGWGAPAGGGGNSSSGWGQGGGGGNAGWGQGGGGQGGQWGGSGGQGGAGSWGGRGY